LTEIDPFKKKNTNKHPIKNNLITIKMKTMKTLQNEETIEILNSLVTINNDRIEGYETALKETEEMELKSLFGRFISTSKLNRQELIREVNVLGGTESTGTKISGKFFRVWMDLKAALTGKDRKAILDSCEFGEEKARDVYKEVLDDKMNQLSEKLVSMINAQKQLLQADRLQVKIMVDSLERG
jgi:uncharacterized protein (TIGR02284 family)